MAPPPPTQLDSLKIPSKPSTLETVTNDDNLCVPIFSFQLPVSATENKSKEAPKSRETKIDSSHCIHMNIEELSNEIFQDIFNELIQSNNSSLSVFDPILQVINEYLAESQSSQEDDNGSSSGFISLSSASMTFNSSRSTSKLGLFEDNFYYLDDNIEKVRAKVFLFIYNWSVLSIFSKQVMQ
jgi:hypothetical protein